MRTVQKPLAMLLLALTVAIGARAKAAEPPEMLLRESDFADFDLKSSLANQLMELQDTEKFAEICKQLANAVLEAIEATTDDKPETLRGNTRAKVVAVIKKHIPENDQQEWIDGVNAIFDELSGQLDDSKYDLWLTRFSSGVGALEEAASRFEATDATLGGDVSGPFGLDEFVINFLETNEKVIRTDQEPDVTAGAFQGLYEAMREKVKELGGSSGVISQSARETDLRSFYNTKLKEILDDPKTSFERKPQWNPFVEALDEKLGKTKKDRRSQFDANRVDHWVTAFTELATGFEKLAGKEEKRRDLDPSERRQGTPSTVTPGEGTVVSGTSLAAVRHARITTRIYRRHGRRAYRIQRITARR
ncbi:MAG: hypothetical protein ACYTG0_11950 [Planctomycetota bacterium]|jgi:hypothetical protein